MLPLYTSVTENEMFELSENGLAQIKKEIYREIEAAEKNSLKDVYIIVYRRHQVNEILDDLRKNGYECQAEVYNFAREAVAIRYYVNWKDRKIQENNFGK